ncbi:MAG: DUF2190 family protein [Gammaproteobacteria bacterium]
MSLAKLVDISNRHSDLRALGPLGTQQGVIVPYQAGGALTPGQVVKFGTADGIVVQSEAETDLHIGIYVGDEVASAGQTVPICVLGLANAVAGDTVTRGQRLTGETTTGRVVPVDASAGEVVIGIALASGLDGDTIPVLVVPSITTEVT